MDFQASIKVDETICDHYDDIMLAHKYRLSLNSVPTQSSFRVLALLFYRTINQNSSSNSNTQEYVVGTNDEPCYIGGSICAERAAMVQLRFIPNLDQITKIVIVTDAPYEIAPGALCREYMASSKKIPWDTHIILSGTKCRFCNHHVTLEDLTKAESNTSENSFSCQSCRHDYLHKTTTLREVYPYPSPYTRFKTKETLAFGKKYALEKRTAVEAHLNEMQGMLLKHAIRVAKMDLRIDLHPIQYGAAILFSDGTISVASQKKASEYGCTLDAVTQLVPLIEQKQKEHQHSKDNDNKNPLRPLLLVQVDQFGITHAPFAKGRAFLTEYGYGDCHILIHNEDCTKIIEVKALNLVPFAPLMENGLLLTQN